MVRGGFALRRGSNNDRGAGILCTNGRALPFALLFEDNRCNFGGGAGYINGASPTFTDCQFIDNLGGSFEEPSTWRRRAACASTAAPSPAPREPRGALGSSPSGIVVTNCVFRDNVATGSGGGALCRLGRLGPGRELHDRRQPRADHDSRRPARPGTSVAPQLDPGATGARTATNASNQLVGASARNCLVQGGVAAPAMSADPEFVDQPPGTCASSAPPRRSTPAELLRSTDRHLDAGGGRFQDLLLVADSGAGTAPVVDLGAFEQDELGEEVACTPQPNSTGSPSVLAANGSPFLNDNLVHSTRAPTGQFAYFVLSDATGNASVGRRSASARRSCASTPPS